MQTLRIAINDNAALEALRKLEEKHLISIVARDIIDTPALPGAPLSMHEFRKWINNAEQAPTVSLEEAKSIWEGDDTAYILSKPAYTKELQERIDGYENVLPATS